MVEDARIYGNAIRVVTVDSYRCDRFSIRADLWNMKQVVFLLGCLSSPTCFCFTSRMTLLLGRLQEHLLGWKDTLSVIAMISGLPGTYEVHDQEAVDAVIACLHLPELANKIQVQVLGRKGPGKCDLRELKARPCIEVDDRRISKDANW